MNKVQLIGRLTRPIELHTTKTGTPVTSFSLAVNGKKKQDGTHDTDFPTITAFGTTAEILAKYTDKGHRISVTGRLRTGSYEKDGRTIYSTDVILEEFDFLEPKGKEMTREQFDDGYIDDHDWDNDPMGNDLPF